MSDQSSQGGKSVSVTGGIRGNQNVVGIDNTATYVTGNTSTPFEAARQQIEQRAEDASVDKGELLAHVDYIEKEADKGTEANEGKLDRWIGFLAEMAPDVWDVLTATLANPAAGFAVVVQKVAARSRQLKEAAAKAPQPSATSTSSADA